MQQLSHRRNPKFTCTFRRAVPKPCGGFFIFAAPQIFDRGRRGKGHTMANGKQFSSHKQLLTLVECALMVALAVILDILPLPRWPNGGSLSITSVPILYLSYRHGLKWGLFAGLTDAVLQLITGWYAPPAGTVWAVLGCVLLDYVLAFTVLGSGAFFASLFGKRRLIGYAFGAVSANLLRFVCSFLSGILLWDSYAPEGQAVWAYSLIYNGGYMIPNAVIAAICIVLLCSLVDPRTLRPMKRDAL